MTNNCIICGKPLTSGDISSHTCSICLKKPIITKGWVCSLCGTSNAPWKEKCDCNQKSNLENYITTEY